MNIDNLMQDLGPLVNWVPVGSRRICNPAPTDTDDDYLVFAPVERVFDMMEALEHLGFVPDDNEAYDFGESAFVSFKKNDINLIVCCDEIFYKNFLRATAIAKELNLLKKNDRVDLFQAVLYGMPNNFSQYSEHELF